MLSPCGLENMSSGNVYKRIYHSVLRLNEFLPLGTVNASLILSVMG